MIIKSKSVIGSDSPIEESFRGTLLKKDNLFVDKYSASRIVYFEEKENRLTTEIYVRDTIPTPTPIAGTLFNSLLFNANFFESTTDPNSRQCDDIFNTILTTAKIEK